MRDAPLELLLAEDNLGDARLLREIVHERDPDKFVLTQVTNIIPEGFAERLIADGTRTATEALA